MIAKYMPSLYHAAVLAAALISSTTAAVALEQPKISSRQIPVLSVEGLKFRDLNRNGQLDPYEDWRLSPKVRAADLTGRMSLAEKAGTMMHGTLGMVDGRYDLTKVRGLLLDKNITAAITRMRYGTASELARQNNALQQLAEEGRLGIPLTISSDSRNHLKSTVNVSAQPFSMWPTVTGFGAIGEADLVRRFGDIARREYRAVGIHMALSPQADLSTEPRWTRINSTFGEVPEQVRELVRSHIEGFQGSSTGLTRDGVISVVKHWAGYGAAAEQGFDAHMAYGRWSGFPGGAFEQHLIPYEGAFEVKVAGVMPTYTILRDLVHEGHSMEQVGGGFNKYLLTDLLRGRFGFEGMILSDFGITDDCDCDCIEGNGDGGMPWGMESATKLERFVKAIQAGIDQLGGTEAPEYLIEAVERGLLEEQQLDNAVQRILVDKFLIGLFENPFVSPEQAELILNNSESQAAALVAQQRSLTLLKNEGAALPIRKPLRVYLLGIDPAAAEGKPLTVVTDSAEADLVIARLVTPRELLHPNSGFGRFAAEGSLAFAPGQKDFDAVVSLAANGLPVIASVNLERPAVMTALLPHVQALFGDFGITDSALLGVILGEAAPEGRLPFELPSSMAAVEAQKPDLPHDSENPLFPIGFGLRYSD